MVDGPLLMAIAALLTSFSTIFGVWMTKRKTVAESTAAIVDAAVSTVKMVQQQIVVLREECDSNDALIVRMEADLKTLKCQVEGFKCQIASMQEVIRKLSDQLIKAGLVPVAKYPEEHGGV